MFTYKANLEFPLFPKVFERTLIEIQRSQQRPLPHYFSGTGEFKIKKVPGYIHDWVKKNICDDYVGLGVQSIEHGNFDPHIDGPNPEDGSERHFSLLYIIEPGGNDISDPVTRFYKTKTQNTEVIEDTKRNRLFRREDVEIIAECQFKKYTWNLISNQCIHSVDNLLSTRICLVLNFITPRPVSLTELGLL